MKSLFDAPEFQRIVEFSAAYDKRHPEPSKNYGIHGVDLRMVLKGPLGATQFLLSTGWYLPETIGARRDQWGGLFDYGKALHEHGWGGSPLPCDLGYHSPHPIYEGQAVCQDACEYLDGKPCYYDGSGLNASRPFEALLREGDEGVWRVLGDYYLSTFTTAERESEVGS